MTSLEIIHDLPGQPALDANLVRKQAVDRMKQAAVRGSASGEAEMSLADLQALVKPVRK